MTSPQPTPTTATTAKKMTTAAPTGPTAADQDEKAKEEAKPEAKVENEADENEANEPDEKAEAAETCKPEANEANADDEAQEQRVQVGDRRGFGRREQSAEHAAQQDHRRQERPHAVLEREPDVAEAAEGMARQPLAATRLISATVPSMSQPGIIASGMLRPG